MSLLASTTQRKFLLLSGSYLIVHADDVNIESSVVFNGMVDYINEYFLAPFERILTRSAGDEEEAIERQITQKMSKEAFHAYFEERRRLAIAAGQPFWDSPRRPVLQKYPNVAPACGVCGVMASSNIKLRVCAKFRHDCSKEYQEADWSQEDLQGEAPRGWARMKSVE